MLASFGKDSREQFCGWLRTHRLAKRNPSYFMEVAVMTETWTEEVRGAEFGDKRLTDRLELILDRLSEKPNLSIPGAMDGRAEMEGAYRFFDNDKVTPEAIMAPHVEGTHQRIRQNDTVLLVQDTTELDLTRPECQMAGVGPLECESRVGLFYHPLMAFTPEGLCLGTTWSKSWARDEIVTQTSRSEKTVQRRKTPIEEKESIRWLEGVRASRDVADSCPGTRCVCVADSEADVYELFAEPRITSHLNELHMLIRACQNRALNDQDGRILEAVRSTDCLAEYTVSVSSRKPKIKIRAKDRQAARDARVAQVEVRATSVTLRPPPRPDRKLPPVTVNVVLVEEPDPPAGQKPIQWILITTLPIESAEQVLQIVEYYTNRWQIEVYFRTLKSGCRVEERYFERTSRLVNCLAVYSIAAWKILYLCRLSRECPDLPCDVVLYPSEWKAVYMAVRKEEPPETPPTLNEIVRMIASLGGYVIRKKTQPGTQTLWIGLQRLHDFATGWTTFGPGAREN